ncbi:hypothetical protein B9Z19DRAFT_1073541 [Tuber borchii]|uniref:Uncharacterized protein n=1 Tax=Tuber borchii TaxID=42251 RepID=A0A2T7A5Y3_TUBBO|nr:hypothetical protein B9Z19DRAFT_1073541 [Tuber borchii]
MPNLCPLFQEALAKELGARSKFWVKERSHYKKVQMPGGFGKRPARSRVSCNLLKQILKVFLLSL